MLIKEWRDEQQTLQLISQILGKYKLATAFQEPQWAHVGLEVNVQGFTTGLLRDQGQDFQINVNLLLHQIEVIVNEQIKSIPLRDGTTIQYYFSFISGFLQKHGIDPALNLMPQEMECDIPLDLDEVHHHYSQEAAVQALNLMKLAVRAQSRFISPLRARKVKPVLFWGTFDISSILIYNQHIPFEDETKVIERAAFDESMIEFGFWFGDDQFEEPAFFILPYPFAEESFTCSNDFPAGSYYDDKLGEFIITLQDLGEDAEDKLEQFFTAGYQVFKEYLEWQGCAHYHQPLRMAENSSKK